MGESIQTILDEAKQTARVKRGDYRSYERFKQRLQALKLTASVYQTVIYELAKILQV